MFIVVTEIYNKNMSATNNYSQFWIEKCDERHKNSRFGLNVALKEIINS